MATSTLIQSLDLTFSDGTIVGNTPSNRRQIETFIAGGTITAGDWVAFDTTQTGAERVATVVQAGVVATGNPLAAGVAVRGAASGEKVDVVVAGLATNANVDGAVVAGSPLSAGAAVAGRAGIATAASIVVCGVALEADTANVASVWVYKQF